VELTEHERRRRLTETLRGLRLDCFETSLGWNDDTYTSWYHVDPEKRHPGWWSLRPAVGRMVVAMYPEVGAKLGTSLLHEFGDINVLEGVYLTHSLESLFPGGARKPSRDSSFGRAFVVKVAADELQKILWSKVTHNPRQRLLAKYAMQSLAAEAIICCTQSFITRLEVVWEQHGRKVLGPMPLLGALEPHMSVVDPRKIGVGPYVAKDSETAREE